MKRTLTDEMQQPFVALRDADCIPSAPLLSSCSLLSRSLNAAKHLRSRPLLQILRGDRILRSLGIPINRRHPPSRAVVEQLNAVDATCEWLLVGLRTPRFVRAEGVSDVAECLARP